MKFLSQIITAGSGSIGGLVASRNRGGNYFRSKVIPVDPATGPQVIVRAIVSQLSALWGNLLSVAQRDAWATYAENVSVIDSLGQTQFLTGQQHYIRSNVPRLQYSLTRVDDAPTVFNLGEFTTPTLAVGTASTNLLAVTFDISDAWVDEDDSSMVVQTSRALAETIDFFKGPFRAADSIDGDATTPPTAPATVLADLQLVADARHYYRVRVSRADGRLSAPIIQLVNIVT